MSEGAGRPLYIAYISRAARAPSNLYAEQHKSSPPETEVPMWDAVFLGAGLAFFAAAIGYTYLCERL
jgi:hypothetical protein